jgi:hypothetical protein
VPRIGAGVAALAMSALSVSLMVVLPSELEQRSHVLAGRAQTHRAAAEPRSDDAHLRCTVPAALNAPLFPAIRATAPDPRCKQHS